MLVFGEAQLGHLASYLDYFSSRIYVDAVINHMAAGGNTGSAGETGASS